MQKKLKHQRQTRKNLKNLRNGYWITGIVIIVALIAIISVLLFVPETPRKAVDGMLSALKQGNFDKVKEYVDYQELLENANLDYEDTENKDREKLFFEKLEWKINKIDENGDNATVEIEITNKDFNTIVTNYMQKVFNAAFAGEDISNEEMENYLLELLRDEQVQTATTTKTIELTKQEGKWKVTANTDLTSALLPGFEDAVNSLNSITE